MITRFDKGLAIEFSEGTWAKKYIKYLTGVPEFKSAIAKLKTPEDGPSIASAMEFVMEGLHLNRRLNRDKVEGAYRYRG